MKLKLLIMLAGFIAGAGALFGYVYAKPKPMPPDGTVRHTWQITWLTSSNTVLVTEPYPGVKVAQTFFSDTAMPRRNWGEQNIKNHWFGLPATFITPTDEDGNRCCGKIVK